MSSSKEDEESDRLLTRALEVARKMAKERQKEILSMMKQYRSSIESGSTDEEILTELPQLKKALEDYVLCYQRADIQRRQYLMREYFRRKKAP